MTVQELADNIADNLDRRDDRIFVNRMKANIYDIRAQLIRQEFTRLHRVHPVVLQSLDNLELEEADDLQCEADIDITVMRTIYRIPNPIRLKDTGSSFIYVGGNDRRSPFTYIKADDIEGYLEHPFTGYLPYYSFLNKHIYVFNSKSNLVNIRAAFGDPIEIRKLKDCNGNYCFTGDFELEQDMSNTIEKMIYEKVNPQPPKDTGEIMIDENPERNT